MKKILISILVSVFIISMITTVYATSGSVSASSSSDTVIKGNTFTVTLAGVSDTPIDGMYTKFNYDKDVLELVSKKVGTNYGDNSTDGEILVTNNSSNTSSTNATLYTLTFKVLENTTSEKTNISFTESELHLNNSGTISEFSVDISDISVKIKADSTTADKLDNTPSDTPSNNSGSQGDSNNITDNSTTKAITKKTSLPQTGVETASIFVIVALGIVSIVSYISYKKYKNV